VEVGKSVQARVLDIVKADGIVDLTLRPELLQLTKQETSTSESGRKKVCTKPDGSARTSCRFSVSSLKMNLM
jgi:predicted RNA-binding protein with RPS1 domain